MRQSYKGFLTVASTGWEAHSRLILTGDNAGWSLDWDMRELRHVAQDLGIRIANPHWHWWYTATPQAMFLASQFFLLKDNWLDMPHRIGFAYFHGLPGGGEALFDHVYEALCKHHTRISRIQAPNSRMRDVILQSRIDPEKVHLIPIGIHLDYFPLRGMEDKRRAREGLGIPQSAFVVGSFQKDGIGWGAGDRPKLIKGPDIFLSAIRELRRSTPDLYVLLSGPARGYVRNGLEEMGVPYLHKYLNRYPDISRLYQVLDLYLVTSRQEGGPKAILESMASGVPIISTRVGQAVDLIEHERNGWLADQEDVPTLVRWAEVVHNLGDSSLAPVLARGRATAEANSYDSQMPLWAAFMKGFVEWSS